MSDVDDPKNVGEESGNDDNSESEGSGGSSDSELTTSTIFMDEEDLKNAQPKDDNVASAVMMKVPTYRLEIIKKCFENEGGAEGIDLLQFLEIFTRNMNIADSKALLNIVPDLLDFSNLVDINGDGKMEWSEFVMFVIEQVVQYIDTTQTEIFQFVDSQGIQATSSRDKGKD